jgi:hypothetical protein
MIHSKNSRSTAVSMAPANGSRPADVLLSPIRQADASHKPDKARCVHSHSTIDMKNLNKPKPDLAFAAQMRRNRQAMRSLNFF